MGMLQLGADSSYQGRIRHAKSRYTLFGHIIFNYNDCQSTYDRQTLKHWYFDSFKGVCSSII